MKYNNPILNQIYQDEVALIDAILAKQQEDFLPIFQAFVKNQKSLGHINDSVGLELYAYMNTVCAFLNHDEDYDPLPEKMRAEFIENHGKEENRLKLLEGDFGVPITSKEEMEVKYLTQITQMMYETIGDGLSNYIQHEVHIWIPSLWQKADLNDIVPVAFMREYYDGSTFDLKQMKFVINHGPLKKGNPDLPVFYKEELRFRIAKFSSDRQVLKKGHIYKEVGFVRELGSHTVFKVIDRTYENEQIISNEVLTFSTKDNSDNDIIFRCEAADLLRKYINDGFQLCNAESLKFLIPLVPCIIPDIVHTFQPKANHSEQTISDFEQKNDIQLPNDYRYFLLTYNGLTTHGYYYFPINERDGVNLISFWGLNRDTQNDIAIQFEICKKIYGTNFLPIGTDSFANLVFLGVKHDNLGQIIYRRFNHFKQIEETYTIAANFQAFLNVFSSSFLDAWGEVLETNDLEKIKTFTATHGDWEYQNIDVRLFSKGKVFRDFLIEKQFEIRDIDAYANFKDKQSVEQVEDTFGTLKPVTYSHILGNIVSSDHFDYEKDIDFIRFLIGRGANPHYQNTLTNYENLYEKHPTLVNEARCKALKPYKNMAFDKLDFKHYGIELIPNGKTSEDLILALEQKLDFVFPDEWRKFFLEYNGGIITPSYFQRVSNGSFRNIFALEKIFSINEIEDKFEEVRTRLLHIGRKDKILPIGKANDNAVLLLNVENNSYYILHEYEIDHTSSFLRGKDKCDNLADILSIFKKEEQCLSYLQYRAYKGDVAYFEKRIQKGFDAFYAMNWEPSTFYYALLSKNLDLVKLFISNEIKVRKRNVVPNFDGYFQTAMSYSSPEIVKYLYEIQGVPLNDHLSSVRDYLVKYYERTYLNDLK